MSPSLPYSPGLDGLRAVAVLAVVFYHWDTPFFDGGYLGVEMFFVISGYLITTLLFNEIIESKTISMYAFWSKRIRRLIPALIVLLTSVMGYVAIFLPTELLSLRTEVLASLAYCINWFFIFQQQSYFEAFGRPSLLQHLWSLAIEEQFYFIWPILFLGLSRVLSRTVLVNVLILGSVSSFLWMAYLYEPFVDPSRIYYGTDSRAGSILLGSAGALLWTPWKNAKKEVALWKNMLGISSFLVLGIFFWQLDEFSSFLYQGGFFLFDMIVLLLIILVFDSTSWLSRLLSLPIFNYIGKRSYGLYLWHWPITQVTIPDVDVFMPTINLVVLRLVLVVLCTELSYRFVEQPIRRWNTVGRQKPIRKLVALTLFFLVAFGVAFSRDVPQEPLVNKESEEVEAAPLVVQKEVVEELHIDEVDTTTPPLPPPVLDITVVGDSVIQAMLPWATEASQHKFLIDADQSRSFLSGIDVIKALKKKNDLSQIVLIHLGNNGYINDEAFDQMMNELQDIPTVIFMTVHVPRKWEKKVNQTLHNGEERWSNVKVIDWHTFAKSQMSWFDNDKIHIQKKYFGCFTRFVIDSLAELDHGVADYPNIPCPP
ncbi:MAG: acyltransferase family protein [Myxococcota bacterium]|nr:acyltransferase family protein [Myxococcota bacterium]